MRKSWTSPIGEEETIRIPVSEERVEVSTHTVPLNDVAVYRREWEEQQQIEAVLRKEVARIEKTGAAQYTEASAGADDQPPLA